MFVSLMTDILLCHLFYSIIYMNIIHIQHPFDTWFYFLCFQVGFLCFVLYWIRIGIVVNIVTILWKETYIFHSWTDSNCVENSTSTKQSEQKQSDLIFIVLYLIPIIFHFAPNTFSNNKSSFLSLYGSLCVGGHFFINVVLFTNVTHYRCLGPSCND